MYREMDLNGLLYIQPRSYCKFGQHCESRCAPARLDNEDILSEVAQKFEQCSYRLRPGINYSSNHFP